MNFFVFSDTHGFHENIIIPDGIDVLIFAGDCSNTKASFINANETNLFLNWFTIQPVKYKIFVAGNHETSIYEKAILRKDIESRNIIYLEHESCNINNINIFGSPYTPTFFNWAFNVDRNKLKKYWEEIPDNTNVLITHGPPMFISDNAPDKFYVKHKGCIHLYNELKNRLNVDYHIFGHIHNNIGVTNTGIKNIPDLKTNFMNVSCVMDGYEDLIFQNNSQIFEI
jgi:Icc-related predicted phosphoesterase